MSIINADITNSLNLIIVFLLTPIQDIGGLALRSRGSRSTAAAREASVIKEKE